MKKSALLVIITIAAVVTALYTSLNCGGGTNEVETTQRLLQVKIKDDCVEQYREYHRNVWPELEKAYKEAGIMQLSCFMDGSALLVYLECEKDLYAASRDALAENEVEVRWQALMKTLSDSSFEFIEYEEVYRMD